ncbi:hypothetical protein LINPERHAP1_LOCUS26617 [Linum perenne]
MDKKTFKHFCKELKEHGGISSSKNVIVEEKIAIFLRVLTHSNTARDGAELFQHSTATISKYFCRVLKAVIGLSKRVIVLDCVGAIDGVHMDACIPTDQQIRFHGRKTTTTQNVMCVCNFDMLLTYVVAGWEGTSNDARILSETTSNPNNQFLMPPQGKLYIYLVIFFFVNNRTITLIY